MFRNLRRLARAVLDSLVAVSDPRPPFRAAAKMVLDDFSAEPGDDKNLLDAIADESLHDVLEDGCAVDLEHRLGKLISEFPHARAFAGRQNNCLHSAQRSSRGGPVNSRR